MKKDAEERKQKLETKKQTLQNDLHKLVKCKSKKGTRLLKEAARGNDKEIVKLLTKPRIDINVTVRKQFLPAPLDQL